MYKQSQLAHSVVMVRPYDFGFNEQTGLDNEFQHRPVSFDEIQGIRDRAMSEFDNMVDVLIKANVEVLILDNQNSSEPLPDAIFPNNWFSTREDGRLYLYPMKTPNRQAEVQEQQLSELLSNNGYLIEQAIDLRIQTKDRIYQGKALEGTGSLIFHHPTSSVFAAISERCDEKMFRRFADASGYQSYAFSTTSQQGSAIYHSNVLMSCGENFAVITESVMNNDPQSNQVMKRLDDIVEDVMVISEQQMSESFCGNILQLCDANKQPLILLSHSAYNGFLSSQIKLLEKHGSLVICKIPTIEHIGGGSARCMVAENFLTTD